MEEKKEMDIYENTEVQELIGYVPTSLQKWGVFVIAMFIMVLLAGSYFFQYPETLKGKIVIPASNDSTPYVSGQLYLPPINFGEVKIGAKVLVFTEAYPESKYGFLTGTVNKIYGIPDASGHYMVEVRFPNGLQTNQGMTLSPRLQLIGTGEVVLREARLIEALVKPVQLINKFKQ